MIQIEIELERVRLPPNWEVATAQDGHTYFVDHNMQTTTNEDPRIQIRQELLNKHVEYCNKSVSYKIWTDFRIETDKQKLLHIFAKNR